MDMTSKISTNPISCISVSFHTEEECVLEILHSHWLILNLLCSEEAIILTSLKIARSL